MLVADQTKGITYFVKQLCDITYHTETLETTE